LALPTAYATTVTNPICPDNTAFFGPGNGEDIVVPPGYSVSVFKSGLNFPTGIAFRTTGYGKFEVYVLESGHGLPSVCNEQGSFGSGQFDPTNPFTPDILVFDESGKLIRGPLAKPAANGDGLQAAGPAVDIAFEQGLKGGRLFVTDSNQATHAAGQNNSSRIVVVDRNSGDVSPFITNLPTGDHPTEQLAFRDGWIYWSQGSTTNSGVVGRDNGGGTNQNDIPFQDIVLSDSVFDSGGTPDVKSSGYSPFGTQRPGRARVRQRDASRRLRRRDSARETGLRSTRPNNRAVLVGLSQRLRPPLRSAQPRPAGAVARWRGRRGRARRAAIEQCA
jgi:hypothetical protein